MVVDLRNGQCRDYGVTEIGSLWITNENERPCNEIGGCRRSKGGMSERYIHNSNVDLYGILMLTLSRSTSSLGGNFQLYLPAPRSAHAGQQPAEYSNLVKF